MKTNDRLPISQYRASEQRYGDSDGKHLEYRTCGESGLKLPALSIGLWHNFGDAASFHDGRKMLRHAFDQGITHFDLANNYGPPYGSAEETFGRVFQKDLKPYRDEMIIATKAGYDMWPGPYGHGGSKKYLISSCEQSLKRMQLDYVDIFYHHCPDPETPHEETADALAQIVRSGKALYIGISNYYDPKAAASMIKALKERGVPLLIHQLRYSMMDRRAEENFDLAQREGFGVIAFSPLEQGILTGKYNSEIPKNSRATDQHSFLSGGVDQEKVQKAIQLEAIANDCGVSLTTLALAWLLKTKVVTSILAGVSRIEQIDDNVKAVSCSDLGDDVWRRCDEILLK
jgi:L-glyceraldehyde 3-phosphate reductase